MCLNPVNYLIVCALQQLVYRQKFKDIDHLTKLLTYLLTETSPEELLGHNQPTAP